MCAKLGIALIHSRPYQPAGRGKIERFFRTLRAAWLRHLTPEATSSLDTLNRTLWAWVEGEYHLSPHRGLDGRTPLDQWELAGHNVRYPDPDPGLDDLFLFEAKRRVMKDRTVSLHGIRLRGAGGRGLRRPAGARSGAGARRRAGRFHIGGDGGAGLWSGGRGRQSCGRGCDRIGPSRAADPRPVGFEITSPRASSSCSVSDSTEASRHCSTPAPMQQPARRVRHPGDWSHARLWFMRSYE